MPAPPNSTSSPSPPDSASLPAPPSSWSAPLPPSRLSFPSLPARTSLPARPTRKLLVASPVRTLSRKSPLPLLAAGSSDNSSSIPHTAPLAKRTSVAGGSSSSVNHDTSESASALPSIAIDSAFACRSTRKCSGSRSLASSTIRRAPRREDSSQESVSVPEPGPTRKVCVPPASV